MNAESSSIIAHNKHTVLVQSSHQCARGVLSRVRDGGLALYLYTYTVRRIGRFGARSGVTRVPRDTVSVYVRRARAARHGRRVS